MAARVAEAWIGASGIDGRVVVRMQRPVGGNVGWVDLELDCRGDERRIIWVEVKLGHRLSGENQLTKYGARLRKLDVGAREWLVLLLAPAQRRSVFAEIPSLSERADGDRDGPFFVSWQDLYGILRDGAQKGTSKTHVNWLLREVLAYMENEELKPSELKPRHLAALRHIDEALAALDAVIDRASVELSADGWKAAAKVPKLEASYWEHEYRPAKGRSTSSRRRTSARLAWGIDAQYVFAGVYFARDAGGPVRPRVDDEWRVALLSSTADSDGWEEDDGERNSVWIGRARKLTDVVSANTVEAQGDELAAFADESFSSLIAARPT